MSDVLLWTLVSALAWMPIDTIVFVPVIRLMRLSNQERRWRAVVPVWNQLVALDLAGMSRLWFLATLVLPVAWGMHLFLCTNIARRTGRRTQIGILAGLNSLVGFPALCFTAKHDTGLGLSSPTSVPQSEGSYANLFSGMAFACALVATVFLMVSTGLFEGEDNRRTVLTWVALPIVATFVSWISVQSAEPILRIVVWFSVLAISFFIWIAVFSIGPYYLPALILLILAGFAPWATSKPKERGYIYVFPSPDETEPGIPSPEIHAES